VVRQLCQDFNVVEVCYDPYQLVDFAQQFKAEGLTYFHEFDQGQARLEADKQLYDLISHRRVRHAGEPELREHLLNANAKQSKDEDTKLRLVKKSANRKIDLAVSLSMGCHECMRLNLA
jgi:phage terminase large subunit-like protein